MLGDTVGVWALASKGAQLVIGLSFSVAGCAKVMNRRQFEVSLSGYVLIPPFARRFVKNVLPLTEIALGLAVASGAWHAIPIVLALILLTIFTVELAANLLLGTRRLHCGCFGTEGKPMSARHISRNVLLTAVGLAALRSPGEFSPTLLAFGITATFLILLGIELLAPLASPYSRGITEAAAQSSREGSN